MSKFPVIHTSCDTGVKHDLSSAPGALKHVVLTQSDGFNYSELTYRPPGKITMTKQNALIR